MNLVSQSRRASLVSRQRLPNVPRVPALIFRFINCLPHQRPAGSSPE